MNIRSDAKGRRSFIEDSYGGVLDYREITIGEYEFLNIMKSTQGDKVFREFVYDHYASDAVKMGYGFYGAELRIVNDVPFLGILRGSSCD